MKILSNLQARVTVTAVTVSQNMRATSTFNFADQGVRGGLITPGKRRKRKISTKSQFSKS